MIASLKRILVAVFGVSVLIALFLGSLKLIDRPKTHSPKAPRPIVNDDPLAILRSELTKELGPSNRGATQRVNLNRSGQELVVEVCANDNFADGLIQVGILKDTLVVAQQCRDSAITFDALNVSSTMPYEDASGVVSEKRVALISFSRSTLQRIDFNTLRHDQVEGVADSVWTIPTLD